MKNRIISWLLVLCMTISMLPATAFAAEVAAGEICDDSYAADYADTKEHNHENGACTVYGTAIPNPYAGKTVACIGDSITYGVGVTRDESDYVTLLAQSLEMDYIRLGASGTTLCTNGHATCNIGKLTEANLAGADVVTVLMGINDFVQARNGYYILGNIDSTDTSTIYGAVHMWCQRIVELQQKDSLKNTEFYFMTPVITSWNNSVSGVRNWDQGKLNIHGYTLRDLCNAIVEVCAMYNISVIDLNLISGLYYNSPEDNSIAQFGGDGAHPGVIGHQMMADAIENAIVKNHLRDDHDHSYGSWITTTYPDCYGGEQQRVCSVCTATQSKSLAGTGHTWDKGICTGCGEIHPNLANYKGKVISIMGDSISTFAGYIPVADGFNREHLARYPQDNLLTDVNETWWMQVVTALDAKLGINDSWRGTTLSGAVPVTSGETGENSAMSNLTRIQNLGSNGTPDVILLYGGTNDLARVSKVGTFDPASAPTEVDLTTKKWDNLADGFVHTLLRMRHYYPKANIVALLPTYTASYYSNEKLAQGNEVMAEICEHYGIPYVDLRESGVTAQHLPDGIHPAEEGMDMITDAVLKVLTEQTLDPGETVIWPVTHTLTNAKASLGHYKGIAQGEAFEEILTGEDLTVTVTMGGVDITNDCYENGVVSIGNVSGSIVITAKGRQKPIYDGHLRQLPQDLCCKTNLWAVLEHDEYYYNDGTYWGIHPSGTVYSVTIPVEPGDQIYATSFGKAGENGSNRNGVRVTFFDEFRVVKTLTTDETYAQYSQNGGCLIVPDSAVAVNIPMWTNADSYEVYILNRAHTYKNSTITKPTCTEPGFTTYTCACGDSYVDDTTEALGHSHSRYSSDNDKHWSICSCGETLDETFTSHTYTDGKCVCGMIEVAVKISGDNISYAVNGRTITVEDEIICRVGYWNVQLKKYISIPAAAKKDSCYIFTAPDGVTEVLIVVMGNVNEDKRVTVSDIAALNAHICGKKTLTAEARFAADVNGDGLLDENDMIALSSAMLGKRSLSWEVA